MLYNKNSIYIDCGVDGGVAYVKDDHTVKVARCPKKNLTLICDLLTYIINHELKNNVSMVHIEHQQSFGEKDRSKDAFVLSENFTCWRTACYMSGVPYVTERPKAWQKKIGFRLPFDYNDRKTALCDFAKKLFPASIPKLEFNKCEIVEKKGKVTYYTADALCMMHVLRDQ